MRLHPFIVAAVLAVLGATAFSANLIISCRAHAGRRRDAAPLVVPDDPSPAPRPVAFVPTPPPAPPPVENEPPPTAALRIRVVGPHGLVLPGAEVTAVSVDDPDGTSYALDDAPEGGPDDTPAPPGTHVVDDLPPGRYDVTALAPGMRTAHVPGVPTGDEVVTISLARSPVLSGAVHAPDGEGCGGGAIVVLGPADEDGERETAEASVGDDCSFSIEGLPEAGPLTVELRRGDDETASARALVTLPVAEDPAFVCLAPPCAAAPASLAVYVADATGRLAEDVALEWTLVGDQMHGEIGTTTGSGLLFLHGRRAGETLQLVASSEDRRVEETVVVRPGVTDVLMTLPAIAAEAPEPPTPTPRRRTIVIESVE